VAQKLDVSPQAETEILKFCLRKLKKGIKRNFVKASVVNVLHMLRR